MSRYGHLYANTEQDLRVIADMDAEARQAELAARLQAHAERNTAWAEATQIEAECVAVAPARASLWRFVDWRSVVGGVVLAVIGIILWVAS